MWPGRALRGSDHPGHPYFVEHLPIFIYRSPLLFHIEVAFPHPRLEIGVFELGQTLGQQFIDEPA